LISIIRLHLGDAVDVGAFDPAWITRTLGGGLRRHADGRGEQIGALSAGAAAAGQADELELAAQRVDRAARASTTLMRPSALTEMLRSFAWNTIGPLSPAITAPSAVTSVPAALIWSAPLRVYALAARRLHRDERIAVKRDVERIAGRWTAPWLRSRNVARSWTKRTPASGGRKAVFPRVG